MATPKVFVSVGHFFASIAHGIVDAGKLIVKDAPKIEAAAQSAQPVIDTVIGVTLGPAAQEIERLAMALLGNAVAVVSETNDAVSQKGLNIPLDQKTISDIKALAPQFQTLAASVGVVKPSGVPVTAPAA